MPFYPHHSKNKWPVSDGVTKRCRKCHKDLSVTYFWGDKSNADGLQHSCKTCGKLNTYGYRAGAGKVRFIVTMHKSKLKRFKITPEDFDRMISAQDYKCAICRLPERAMVYGVPKRLAIDHCHKTGRVRGLLCQACNRGIGYLGDSKDLLQAALKYLSKG